ncbi:migration and invasion enhancer 1 isoform X2 [Malaya genurostris]|uniref:migration and invasion enhancer 1 isoform X2 n=1 Tax=Malaya genurostris TaxID=325434 RepID=UPI0026F37F2E|nr:migration and invasion enhancer 1 isoform X2 [Malaya genurostris]
MEQTEFQQSTVRVEIEYCNVCNSQPQCLELSRLIEERVPEAQVTCRTGRRGSFEVQINETLVHSKLSSLAFPDYGEVVSNVMAAKDGQPVKTVKEQPITDCVVQ